MTDPPRGMLGADALRGLGALNRCPASRLATELLGILAPSGATGVRLMFADVEERVLKVCQEDSALVVDRAAERSGHERVDGSTAGEVYVSGEPQVTEVRGVPAVLTPITARAERIGVLEVRFASPPDDAVVEAMRSIGLLVGYIAVAADHWTDEFHVARRREEMNLAAEIQWNILPLGAFSAPGVSLGGALEPAYEIGGDAFDYAHNGEELFIGVFDSMGHGLAASRLSVLVTSAFRNARRRGQSLHEQALFIDENLRKVFDQEGFATGQLLRIDLADPEASSIVNAGHPWPFVQRGNTSPERIRLPANRPFGVPFANELSPIPVPLHAGDRVTLFSDGVTEARPEGGEAYGEAALRDQLEAYRPLPPREAARRIIGAVREHRAADLLDDATIVVIDVELAG